MRSITETRNSILEVMLSENRIGNDGKFKGGADLEKDAREYIHHYGEDVFLGRQIIRFAEIVQYVNEQLGYDDNDDITMNLNPLRINVTRTEQPNHSYDIQSKNSDIIITIGDTRFENSVQLAKFLSRQ